MGLKLASFSMQLVLQVGMPVGFARAPMPAGSEMMLMPCPINMCQSIWQWRGLQARKQGVSWSQLSSYDTSMAGKVQVSANQALMSAQTLTSWVQTGLLR